MTFGFGLYGKTDEVPGLFHVATKFEHMFFVPILPQGSYLILNPVEPTGIPIPCSLKSVLLGYGRGWTLVTAVGTGILVFSGDARMTALENAWACAVAVTWFLTLQFKPRFRYSSYKRACELAKVADLGEKARILIDLQFGKVSREEAKKKLLRAEFRGPRSGTPHRGVQVRDRGSGAREG